MALPAELHQFCRGRSVVGMRVFGCILCIYAADVDNMYMYVNVYFVNARCTLTVG